MTNRSSATRRPLLRAVAGVALPAVLVLAACGQTEEPGVTAGTTEPGPTTTATPDSPAASPSTPDPGTSSDDDTDAPGFGTVDDATASQDALLTVTDLRAGSHDGYDRVVVELAGTGTPGWHTEVGASATENPTGAQIELGGQAVLTLYLSGLGLPYETGQTELSADTVLPGVGDAITGAAFTGTFEGEGQVFVGLGDADAEYRVFALSDPTRIVVDVRS